MIDLLFEMHPHHETGLIEKMRKPKIVRLLQGRKAKTRGFDEMRTPRREQKQAEELRRAGIDSLSLHAGTSKGPVVVSMDEVQAVAFCDAGGSEDRRTASIRLGRRQKKKKNIAPVFLATREIHEDYSEYSKDVANVLHAQDNDLDLISDALADMKATANAMNSELDYQNHLIGRVQDYTVHTAKRTKQHANKIALID